MTSRRYEHAWFLVPWACLLVGCPSSGPSSGDGLDGDVPGGDATPGDEGTGPVDTRVDPDAQPAGGETGGTTPVTPTTKLPALPALGHVTGSVLGDAVKLQFDPVDGAKDYRVYVLPADGDITVESDGHVSAKSAIYRCAGARMAPAASADAVSGASAWVRTLVDGAKIDGYTRSKAEATLGYVYATEGPGRIPVYALGDPRPKADNECYYGRWTESRLKTYTTSADERASLIGKRWRDDGIAFYVDGGGAVSVQTAPSSDGGARLYFVDGPEAKVRKGATPTFKVLAAKTGDAVPLMRVHYANGCGDSHDELVAGDARFQRAYHQGNQPLTDLHWSGLTAPTTLVIEALDDLCPYAGTLAPTAKPAMFTMFGTTKLDYPTWLTLDQAKAASPLGELFINGQGEATKPKPIARTFVKVEPTVPTGLDFFEGFSAPLAPFADEPDCGAAAAGSTCWQQFRRVSKDYDTDFMFTETERNGFAAVLGELWTGYGDVGADVGGKFRFTPKARAKMAGDSFLYVTMETSTFTTGRRYPQIIISDQAPPIDWAFEKGHSLVVQTFNVNTSSWPNQLAVEVCDARKWDVNQQCPAFHDLHENLDPASKDTVAALAPTDEVGEHAGLDRSTTWEVWASSHRVYLYLDGKPHGCADLPTTGIPTGSVSVTFGDVLYHSGVDSMDNLSTFVGKHGQLESHRHFDNLGWKNGAAPPPWNETLFPCAKAAQMGKGG